MSRKTVWEDWGRFLPDKVRFARYYGDPSSIKEFKNQSEMRKYLKSEFPDRVFRFKGYGKFGNPNKYIQTRFKTRAEFNQSKDKKR